MFTTPISIAKGQNRSENLENDYLSNFRWRYILGQSPHDNLLLKRNSIFGPWHEVGRRSFAALFTLPLFNLGKNGSTPSDYTVMTSSHSSAVTILSYYYAVSILSHYQPMRAWFLITVA